MNFYHVSFDRDYEASVPSTDYLRNLSKNNLLLVGVVTISMQQERQSSPFYQRCEVGFRDQDSSYLITLTGQPSAASLILVS